MANGTIKVSSKIVITSLAGLTTTSQGLLSLTRPAGYPGAKLIGGFGVKSGVGSYSGIPYDNTGLQFIFANNGTLSKGNEVTFNSGLAYWITVDR